MDETTDIVAFALYLQGWLRDEETATELDANNLREKWLKEWIPSLSQEHCGDCTKQPCPCTRCHTEAYIEEAKYIISVCR